MNGYVFFINAAIVIGSNTTGHRCDIMNILVQRFQNLHRLLMKPLFFVASATLVIPTSITTASSFTISAFTNSGLPRCRNNDIRLQANFFQILCMRMANVTVQLPGLVLPA